MTVNSDHDPEALIFPRLGADPVALSEKEQLELVWDFLDERQQVAMKVMVSEGLRRLADSVESWLPADIALNQAHDYVIQVTWKNRHLDQAIVALLAMAADDRGRRVDELRDLAGGASGANRPSR